MSNKKGTCNTRVVHIRIDAVESRYCFYYCSIHGCLYAMDNGGNKGDEVWGIVTVFA